MNVSYRWLQALAPGLELSPEELAARLASLGAPVEELRPLALGLEGIRIGRVLSLRRHPDADRLTLCRVDGGNGEVEVVCGAPNVREGGWYPFAPVGSSLPGGITIRRVKIRGERSEGMLCSERELGLGRDHEGIMELHGDFAPGDPLVPALGLDDWRLDVEVTSNRPDLLSHRGIAREVAPGGEAGLVVPPIPGGRSLTRLPVERGGARVEIPGIRLTIEDPELCPRYLGAVIRGVRVAPSPPWLASRLRAAGSRPINNVVDATNYVLLELGQPLHAFDLARLAGGEIKVRRAAPGEGIRTLDGVERKLTPEMLCICDARAPVALAGVMGGEESEVTEITTDLLLECALFQPARVRSTRRALAISTDASYRFERGVDPEGLEAALLRCVEIILAVAGGELVGVGDANPAPWSRPLVRLRPARVERILGIPFSPEGLRERLEPLGFPVREGPDGALAVEVPGFRSWDVRREIDLIEEVARTHGYDQFPSELGSFRPGTVPDDAQLRLMDRLRGHLAGRGFFEALTLAFSPPEEGEVELLNPLSVEESRLRSSLLPGLLRRVEHNFRRGIRDVRLFELGTTFHASGGAGGLPREETRLAVVLTGHRHPAHWSGEGMEVDIWDLKALMEDLLPRAGLSGAVLEPGDGASILSPGLSLAAREGGGIRGWGGRVRDGVLDAPPWAGGVWGLELILPDEPTPEEPVRYRPLPQFPGVERDLALLLPPEVAAAQVEKRIREAAGELLEGVEPFDLYRGSGVPEGFRSVAFRLRFRAPDRTLVEGEVTEALERVLGALKESPGVEPRR